MGGGVKLKGFTDLLMQQSNVSQQSNVKIRLGNIPTNIRISDTRLSSIAMLNNLSQECMEILAPVIENVDTDNDDDDDNEPGPQPVKVRKIKGPSIWSKLKDKAMGTARGIFDEPDEEDDN